jgi:hypothetical protein
MSSLCRPLWGDAAGDEHFPQKATDPVEGKVLNESASNRVVGILPPTTQDERH